MKKTFYFFIASLLLLVSCSENYSNGERIGFVTKFSSKGYFWKSWEGELNITQTGMNTSSTFDFSVDNDREDPAVVAKLDSAANLGWKVKLIYHETFGKNWFQNRGETDHFIKDVVILDRNPLNPFAEHSKQDEQIGKILDTIYVVIVGRSSEKK